MVRLAVLLILLCLTVWEWLSGTKKRTVYWLALVGLFIFFSLRYGQGTDYLTYLSIYANVPPLETLPYYGAYQYNKIEIGFFYLISFFRMLRVHYILFIAIITAFSLLCIHRFIRRFSPLPIFALTIFFAIYSLTYMESGIRQLLSISIALGLVCVDWADGRRLRPLVGILIASLMHNSGIVLLVLPLLFSKARPLFLIQWKARTTALWLALLVAAIVVLNFVDLTPVIQLLPARIEYTILAYYSQDTGLSLMALANRTLFMGLIFLLTYLARDTLSADAKLLFNLYCVGYAIYLLFMSFDVIASRLNVYFRIVEICLIPLLFAENRAFVKRTVVALPVMLALLSFLYVKDIAAIMDFSQYYSSNPLQYPYITVFNTDRVYEAKYVNVKNANAINAYQAGGKSWDEYYESLQRKPSTRSPYVPY